MRSHSGTSHSWILAMFEAPALLNNAWRPPIHEEASPIACSIAFASRGLAWTAISAECVASQIEGEPLPLEGSLVDAIDPGRFAVKRARRGAL